MPPWFLEIDSPSGHTIKAKFALYDRCKELINTWVFICGKHPEKGLYGRIRESIGNHMVRVEARSGTRLVDIDVDYLYSP